MDKIINMKNKIIISGKKYAVIPQKLYLHDDMHIKTSNNDYITERDASYDKQLEFTYLFKKSIIDADLNYSLNEILPLIKNYKVKRGCFLVSENESYTYSIDDKGIVVSRYPLKYENKINYNGYNRAVFSFDNKEYDISKFCWLHLNNDKFLEFNYKYIVNSKDTNTEIKAYLWREKHAKEISSVFFKLLFYLEYGSVEFIDLNDIEKKENKSTAIYNPIPDNITIVDKKWNRQYAEKTTLVKEFIRRQKYGKGRQKEKMVIVSAHSRTYHKKTKIIISTKSN